VLLYQCYQTDAGICSSDSAPGVLVRENSGCESFSKYYLGLICDLSPKLLFLTLVCVNRSASILNKNPNTRPLLLEKQGVASVFDHRLVRSISGV